MIPILAKKFVITPFLPKSSTHEYAPMNGADIEAKMIKIFNTFLPFTLKKLKKYAIVVPIIKANIIPNVETINELTSVDE